jgi:hypothetical protein
VLSPEALCRRPGANARIALKAAARPDLPSARSWLDVDVAWAVAMVSLAERRYWGKCGAAGGSAVNSGLTRWESSPHSDRC